MSVFSVHSNSVWRQPAVPLHTLVMTNFNQLVSPVSDVSYCVQSVWRQPAALPETTNLVSWQLSGVSFQCTFTHPWICFTPTKHPKNHRCGLRFVLFCRGLISPISFRALSLALGQSYDCPSASEAPVKDMANTSHESRNKPIVWDPFY